MRRLAWAAASFYRQSILSHRYTVKVIFNFINNMDSIILSKHAFCHFDEIITRVVHIAAASQTSSPHWTTFSARVALSRLTTVPAVPDSYHAYANGNSKKISFIIQLSHFFIETKSGIAINLNGSYIQLHENILKRMDI